MIGKRNRGSSLIAILVAMALLGILVLIYNSWVQTSASGVQRLKIRQSKEDMRLYVRGMLNCDPTAQAMPAACRNGTPTNQFGVSLFGHGNPPTAFVGMTGSKIAKSEYTVRAK